MRNDEVDVQLVRWPAESDRRDRCRDRGLARLLIVEGGADPPVSTDVQEDWVRAPISRSDLDVRMTALRARSDAARRPQVDPHGVVSYAGSSITVSHTATDLLDRLCRDFGTLVERSELYACLPENGEGPTRNALDLQIMRLRRRLRRIELAITTVWGRGYVLTTATPAQAEGIRGKGPRAVAGADAGEERRRA